MFRWKTPLGSDNAVKHGAHNQKKHGNRGGAVMAGARVKFGKARSAGGDVSTGGSAFAEPLNETEILTYETALEVARSQGKSDELAQRFASRALEIARSAPLSVVTGKSVAETHAGLLERMSGDYTEEEYRAWRKYPGNYAFDINASLRGRFSSLSDDEMAVIVPGLDNVTRNKDRVPENMTVSRIITFRPEERLSGEFWKPGMVISDKAYMSTTIDPAYIAMDRGKRSQKEVTVIMNIRVPAGHPAVYDPSTRQHNRRVSGETDYVAPVNKGEMVFGRNTNMIIRGMEQRNGVWYMDAEILPDD
jgi:hypothetical protein